MGLFKRLFGIPELKKPGKYTFSDEDREISSELRQKKKELELLKMEKESELYKLKLEKQRLELQQDIDELKGVYDGAEEALESDSDDTTNMLIKMFAPMLVAKFQNPAPVTPTPVSITPSNSLPPQPEQASLTMEQLKDTWKNTPGMVKKMAKKMDDETIKGYILQKMPNLDDASIARAIEVIRND